MQTSLATTRGSLARRTSVPLAALVLGGLLAAPLEARQVEPTAAAFLDIDVDPRGVAMGGTGWAASRDLQSAYSNPAGLSDLTLQRAGLMHAAWFEGLSLEWAGYGVELGEGSALAIAATFLRSGAVDRFDAFGNPEGTFHVYDAALGVSFGQRLAERFRAGVTAKVVHQSVDEVTATGLAGDVGATYDAGFGRLAFVARNLGADMKIEGEDFPLPTSFSLGASFPFFEEKLHVNVGGNVPLYYYDDVRLGVEVRPVPAFALRAGYRYVIEPGASDQLTTLTYGVGVWAANFRVDYAFQPFDELGDTHRIGLTAVFGGGGRASAAGIEGNRPADTAPTPPPAADGPAPRQAETASPTPPAAASDAAPKADEQPAGETPSGWIVVAGTHRSRISALQELRSLRINGLDGGTLQKLDDGRYRIVVGEFDSRENAGKWIDGPGVKHGKLSFSIVPLD